MDATRITVETRGHIYMMGLNRPEKLNAFEAAFQRLMPDLMPVIGSQDAHEGVMSFIERRKAVFKGK